MRKPKTLSTAALGIVALLSVSGCVGSGQATGQKTSSGSGETATGTVVVGTWGGDYSQFQKDSVWPVLAKSDPNVKPVLAIADSGARDTKLAAEKNGKSSIDVVMETRTGVQKLIDGGLLMKLDMSKIPNAKNIQTEFKDPYCIPHIVSLASIVYNPKYVTAPTSYASLWDPKYRGKIGFWWTGENWFPVLFGSAGLKAGGDPGENLAQGWPGIQSMKSTMDPKSYASNEALGQALQTGEIWATIAWKARGVQWNNAGGEQLKVAIPKETVYPYISCASIATNAKNPDAAYAYLNALLDPAPQKYFAEKMGYGPSVTNANLSVELENTIGSSQAVKDGLVSGINYENYAKHQAEWTTHFDQIFQK